MKAAGNEQLAVGKVIQTKIVLFTLVLSIAYCLLPTHIFGQRISATATIDTNAILIGQKTRLTLRVDYSTNKGDIKIDFPKIADTLIKQIEVVEKGKPERFLPDSADMTRLAMSQTLIITSFDSGYYAIPPFRFVISGDSTNSLETEALLLAVNTVEVDTSIAIKDIKPPMEVPFSWKELLPYVYAGLAGVAVLAGLVFLILYLVKSKKKKPEPAVVVPKIPAHVTALEQLEKLREEKLWQNGKLKEYHSALSDILRLYIEKRFYVNAMEQVTDEIMYAMHKVRISEEYKAKLRNVLFLSDLVKFAKEHPLPQENEGSWNTAYEFVSATAEPIGNRQSAVGNEQPTIDKSTNSPAS